MKAMILAAGLGTRLLPFTESIPKPLFTISGRPLLDIIIHRLQSAGCKAVIINTHHLYKDIDSFLASQQYAIPVYTLYEPVILGTAGAIKNAADFWDNQPFMVINSDIVTDIDLRKVYDFHLSHNHQATLVLHDCAEFNNVWVDKNDFIAGIHDQEKEANLGYARKLTFTGIQVLDPEILEFIPDRVFSSSIDVYRKLILSGKKIKAYISKKYYWKDIGTPERYKETVFDKMAPEAFKRAFPACVCKKIECSKLKGDGSDRKWYRLTAAGRSIVMVDHGIRKEPGISEIDSFILIGRHLYDKGIAVPEIYLYDTFSGIVFLEDLGDVNLQAKVKAGKKILFYYKSIIKLLIKMSIVGVKEFDRSWTCQTPYYDKEVILENECRYFVDAFLRRYLKLNICYDDFKDEFILLADKALEFSVNGFMHRDFQSRNIMIKDGKPYFIDFQGGRTGPIQYDLASLLIDPYVALPRHVQYQLLDYCIDKLSSYIHIDKKRFCLCYKYCAITRNLQILGAFGHLSLVKGKTYFEQFIPTAIESLKYNLSAVEDTQFPRLKSVVS
ncbi:MAG: phosphotransferase [Desulfobacteraceae bacterium]|nr:phosphotransferase [Pseudomonadota bacterium]MBU4463914.1 phosphotransferase [Pseudomonadota bacterium]MCG2754160.1 phosphotransferase [Desulfobacteraceae bacterium]